MTEYQLDILMLDIANYMKPADDFLVSVSLKNGDAMTGRLTRLPYNTAKIVKFKPVAGKELTYQVMPCEPFA